MENLTTIEQLKVKIQDVDFVDKTIQQINKDLTGLCNLQVVNIQSSYNKLQLIIDQLHDVIIELTNNQCLSQFIYKVDLNEKYYKSFLLNQNNEELAINIVIREAQKVFLKQKFA